MMITPEQARAELARRELARRQAARTAAPQKQGVIRSGWNALAIPEQKSEQGLNMIADLITPKQEITGNRLRDVAMNTPAIGVRTLAKVAPGFISRGSILTGMAAPALRAFKPLAGAIGTGVANQLESLAGAKPGVLTEAFKDPTLIFSRIPKEAKEAYQAENAAISTSQLSKISNPMRMISKARQLASEGKLTEGEALEARKEVDKLFRKGGVTEAFKNTSREIFDDVVKGKQSLADADVAYARGKKAAALRQFLPQNKYGGTSAFKLAIQHYLPWYLKPLLSPAAMGAGATAAGAASRLAGPVVTNPRSAVGALQALRGLRNLQKNQKKQNNDRNLEGVPVQP